MSPEHERDDQPDYFSNQPWQLPVKDFTVDDVKALCVKLVPQWNKLAPEDIRVVRFHSGTLNYVFKVIPRIPNELPIAVFRVFENTLDIMIDRAKESESFKIGGEIGVGPKLLALYDNFANRGVRIEEFIEGRNTTYKEYFDPKIIVLVAEALADIHTLMTPRLDHWSKEPDLIRCMNKWYNDSATVPGCEKIYNLIEFRGLMDEYLTLLKNRANTNRLAFNIMLCHNDIHLFNILLHNNNDKVTILDYEFIGFNYIGYDLINYICEACVDYTGLNVMPFLQVFVDMIFPAELEDKLVRAYLTKRGIQIDDEFLIQFKKDIRFMEIGWWLARVVFNAVLAFAAKEEVKIQSLIAYSQLSMERYKFLKQVAIDQGNFNDK